MPRVPTTVPSLRLALPATGLACLLALAAATAGTRQGPAPGSRAEVRKSVEHSMLVTGTIDISPQGDTVGFRLDQPDKVPQVVRDLLARAVPKYRFEPPVVGGKPVLARAKMGVRVVATQQDDGTFRLRVGGANFGEDTPAEGESVTSVKMTPPAYPPVAYMNNGTGTVYLLVKVDATGAVSDVLAEQVNLRVLGNGKQMEKFRKVLADASVGAARKWRFRAPVRGPAAAQSEWIVRVPVDYRFHGDEGAAYGKWEAYVPGPRARSAAFPTEDDATPDAMVAGAVQQVGRGPKLLSQRQG